MEKGSDQKFQYPMQIFLNDADIMNLLLGDYKTLSYVKEMDNITYKHPQLHWSFTVYENDIADIFKRLTLMAHKDHFQEGYDQTIVILKVDSAYDKSVSDCIKAFSKLCYQPFLIFLTNQKENIENINLSLKDSIKDSYLETHITLLKYNPCNRIEIYKTLFAICSYYNQLGDEFIFPSTFSLNNHSISNRNIRNDVVSKDKYDLVKKNYTNHINFLIIGRPGAGKSALINAILGRKRCLENAGKSATYKIMKYHHDKYPLAFYDTKGFETNKDMDIIYHNIQDMNKKLNTNNDVIHMLIYVMNANDARISYETELEFLKKIHEWLCSSLDKDISNKAREDIPLIFVYTHGNDIKKTKVMKQLLLSQLASVIKFKDPLIFAIELYGKNAYGLDKLYSHLHTYFKGDYISKDLTKSIDKLGEKDNIYSMLSGSRLLSKMKSIDDIINYCENKAYIIILSAATITTAIGAIPIPIEDMLLISAIQIGMVLSIGVLYGLNIQLDDARKRLEILKGAGLTGGIVKGIEILIKTLKLIPGLGAISSLADSAILFSTTLAIGIGMMHSCKETLQKDGSKPFIIQAIEEFNSAIEAFELLQKKPKKIDKKVKYKPLIIFNSKSKKK